MGVEFEIAPRSEGDFASLLPTHYGGVVHVHDGPSFTWQSEAASGFVRAPGPVPSNFVLVDERADFVVYVPIVNGNLSGAEKARLTPLWFEGDPFRVVHKIETPTSTFFLHEAPGVSTLGYSLGIGAGNAGLSSHVYNLLSSRNWRTSVGATEDGCSKVSGLDVPAMLAKPPGA